MTVLMKKNAENLAALRIETPPATLREIALDRMRRAIIGGLFEPAWNPEKQPDQWARLAELVAERDPKRIAINVGTA